ncbi:MAG: hypothetical protein ACI35P_12985 [Bacillus sp. (in: firmicutes)]
MKADTNIQHKNDKRKISIKFSAIMAFLLIIIIGLIIVGVYMIVPAVNNTKTYNAAVSEYNTYVDRYNELCKNASVDNIGGIAGEAITLDIVDESFFAVIQTLFKGNNAKKIVSDTETLRELSQAIKDDIQMISQITAPDETWVMDRIKNAEHVIDVQCVTSKHDPNQMLGKTGGYTGCVYFTISVIDPNTVEGMDIVDKGTDVGGCIEIYSTLEDAEARCAYLAGFDNTILYTGFYAIVGTMVVRTSYRLNDEQQYALTDEITFELTRME